MEGSHIRTCSTSGERLRALVDDAKNGVTPHECQWGELETSRLAGTSHRKCQVPGCKMVNILDDDEIPFGRKPESVEKTIGQVRGREIGFGRLSVIVSGDGVTLHVDDDADDEFWLDIHLSRQELADILLQCGEESR